MLAEALRSMSPGGKPRELLLRAAEALDRGRLCVLLRAPTGYGKTTLSLAIYKAIREGWDGAIALTHVLPLRSIGDDLYYKAVMTFYGLRPDSPSYRDIGVQHSFSPGSPMLGRRFNIVTLDTFLMSLFKLPVFALGKVLADKSNGQYEIPRGFVVSSLVYFDEVHLYFQGKRMSSLFMEALRALSDNRVPVVIASATVPDDLKERLARQYGKDDCEVIDAVPSDAPKRCLKLTVYKGDHLSLVRELVKEGKSVLLVRNTVKQAVEDYRALRDLSPILIHGRLSEGDRVKRVSELLSQRELKGRVVVATQVVEAGVDVSADVLITSASPPESLEQRMGRVARYGGEGEAYVLAPTDEDYAVYGKEKVDEGFSQFAERAEQDCPSRKSFDYEIEVTEATGVSSELSLISRTPFMTSERAAQVLREVCSLVREEELVTAFPRELMDRNCKREGNHYHCVKVSDIAVPLSRKALGSGRAEFLAFYEGKYFVTQGELREGKCMLDLTVDLQLPDGRRVRVPPLGVVVSGYDAEVGLVAA